MADTWTILKARIKTYCDTLYDAAGTAAEKIAASISDGDTTHAPSGNAVFDALALKTGITWNVISGNTNAVSNNGYLINASAGNITLTLPATPSVGNVVAVCDVYNKASTNVITIARNGSNIEGNASDLILDLDGSGFELVYVDATRGWEIVSEIGTPGFAASTIGLGRNAIINGDFNVWQRGTSFASAVHGSYPVDRFIYSNTGGIASVHTVSQDTDVPTQSQSGHLSNYSLKVDCTTADASITATKSAGIQYRIEGFNFAPFVGRTVTLSFWVKATKIGIYCIAFRNTGPDRAYVTEYTINVANTWEKKTITFIINPSGGTWNYTNSVGISIFWVISAGSNFYTTKDAWQTGNYFCTSNQVNGVDSTDNNFWLSQVQFELGSAATPFEYEQFGTTLRRCQRYFEKNYDTTTAPGTSSNLAGAMCALAFTVANAAISVNFVVTKRATPAITLYSRNGTAAKVSSGITGLDVGTTVTGVYLGQSGFGRVDDSGSGFTVGIGYEVFYTASAEL